MKCAEFGADNGQLCARCSHSTPSIEGRVSQQRDGLTGPPTRLQWRQLTLSERGTVINSFEKLSPSSFALSSCRKSSGEVGFSLSLSGKTGRSWMDGWILLELSSGQCGSQPEIQTATRALPIPQQRAAPSYVPSYSSRIRVPSITQLCWGSGRTMIDEIFILKCIK